MKKSLLSLFFCFFLVKSMFAQVQVYKDILSSTSISGNSRAPQGSQRLIKTAYLIRASEMTAGGVPANTILNSILFFYQTAQNIPTTGNLKIYLKNTDDVTFSASTTWNTLISDMVLASDASATIPASTGAAIFPFSNGSTFKYTNGGVYVAFEYSNPSGALANTANVAYCVSYTGLEFLKNSYNTSGTAITTLSNSSTFRPNTSFGYLTYNNDAAVSGVYALAKNPLNFGQSEVITALIENRGENALTNLDVTLSITGANTFTNVKSIASLAPNTSTVVTFNAFTASAIGNNVVTVSIPSDDQTSNNSLAVNQKITSGEYAVSEDLTSIAGSVGAAYSGGVYNGMVLTKYNFTGSPTLTALRFTEGVSSSLDVDNINAYAVVLSEDGSTLVGRSNDFTLRAADKGKTHTLFFQTPLNLTASKYLVGIAYTNALVNTFPVAYKTESPTRPNTFYRMTGGVTPGTAIVESTVGIPLMEAVLSNSIVNDVSVEKIYALSKSPLVNGGGEVISAIIKNNGDYTYTNYNVSLNITGSNNFTTAQTIPNLAKGESVTVNFSPFTATATGNTNITVSVPADDNTLNNSLLFTQAVTDGDYSYTIGTARNGNMGAATSGGIADGLVAVKYHMTGTKNLKAVKIRISSSTTLDGNNIKVYAVVLSADGSTTIGRSDDYTILQADKDTDKIFSLQTPVSLTNQDFYVGLVYFNTGGVNTFPLGYQTETALKANTYYRRTGGYADGVALIESTTGRMMIDAILESSSTLPVQLTSYAATKVNNSTKLTWTTSEEKNSDYFEILKSTDGVSFSSLDKVTAKGFSSSRADYQYYDQKPANGYNYYQLLQYDKDGAVKDYGVKVVSFKLINEVAVSIYPNPASKFINVKIQEYNGGLITASIIDMSGKQIYSSKLSFTESDNSTQITLPEGLSKGMYILSLEGGNISNSQKITIQ